ncbi:CUB domain-containing protein 1a isoform X2 [Cololabis saira]|uniref:CUB domain-containing protein 1a isoform X2 n=1 Tax=Cololabis saira TaxID=129043 RepID=UPI002AD59527|nr:CUB domain-containing protein 1a isoform X2 [Cololabis saira]
MSRKSRIVMILLSVFVSTVSGAQKFDITPDRGTTINIIGSQPKGCEVCTGSGRSQRCSTSLSLQDNTRVSVEFKCSRPQDVFTVEIVESIECDKESCSGHIIQADSGSLPLLGFQRNFTWIITAKPVFKLDFTKTGLRQIKPSDKCPDSHTYTLRAGEVVVGRYCRAGTVSSAQILNQGSFSLDVPAGQKLQRDRFIVSVGEQITSLAKISVTLTKDPSELLSPNYPQSFPDDDVMQWYFHIPEKHKATVQFLHLTQPRCLKKETAVEYHSRGRGSLVLSLDDAQPVQTQGNFSLTLRNCEMDKRRSGSPGLSLSLKVSASRSSSPVLCKVALSQTEGLSLHIDNVRPDSDCEMKINSKTMKNITVTSNSEISFQDCLPQDVKVTATRVIEWSHLKGRMKTPLHLSVPLLPSCLPAALSKGAIQKVLIHTNASVTWRSSLWSRALRSTKHVLSAAFEGEIAERYIFKLAPSKNTSVLVGTPGWPAGMSSYSTVSWIVSVPPKMKAHLMFTNISQPKCSNRHTNIRVQRIGRTEEDYSRREDEEAKREITVSQNFYLNMSNCMPERGQFSVITKITLQKRKHLLLTIILSAVAALLVIFVVVLVVVCMMVRKKKKKLNEQVGIYNSDGANFLPGHNGCPVTHEDDESHVYASIEDTLVYTHLLKKGAELGIYQAHDTYQSFTGHKEPQKPLASKASSDVGMEVHQPVRLPSEQGPPLPNRPLSHIQVENDIYQTEDQNQEQCSPNLGPRLEPEGGD